MIFDNVKNLKTYKGLPGIDKIMDFISQNNLLELPEGRTDIDGDNLYVMLQKPKLINASEARPEGHERYIDLQLVLEGTEVMGYVEKSSLGEPDESFPDRDVSFWNMHDFDLLTVSEDMFAVFFPQDGHAPGIASDNAKEVLKAVFKIKI